MPILFDEAVLRLRALNLEVEDDAVYEAGQNFTSIILRHKPANASEAAAILNVAHVEFSMGGRSDGLDLQALAEVERWLDASSRISKSASTQHMKSTGGISGTA